MQKALVQTCLLAMMTGTGLVSAPALAQTSAPVPLFLKQEAEQDAERQSDQGPTNPGATSAPLSGGFGSTSNTQTDTFPSDPNAVQSLSLGAVDSEAVGTLDRSRGGLGIDMWNGTTRRSAAQLISELPATPATHAARDLQRRMLLSAAALPQDSQEISLLEARVAKLIEMGALDDAIELVRAAPQGSRGSMLAQAEVNALLIGAEIDAACDAIESYSASYDELFWLKAAAMCAFYANDPTSAAFSVDLVREMGGEGDATFFGLVSAIRSGNAANPELLNDLRPLDLALLAIAKQSIPTSQLENGNPAAIIGITNADATATDVRLEAARKAEKLGLISPEQLASVYRSVSFTADALANVLDDASEGIQARQYAKLYQAAAQSDVPAARAEILAALFETAEFEGDFMQAARLSAPLMADIPVNGDFSWFAVPALKASIASNGFERAANWLQVAKSSANASNDISSRLSLLYPVLAMSGLEETGAVKPQAPSANGAGGNSAQTFGTDGQIAVQNFGLGGAVVADAPTSSGGLASATVMPNSTSAEDVQSASDRAAAIARHRARMVEWQEMQAARGDQAAARRYSELIFNLFEGYGIEVPDALWDSLLTAPYAEERVTTNSAVSHHLITAAAAQQKAKTVAMAIQAQQVASAENADPKALSDTVTALATVGLEADARRLATELLMSFNQ
ncbi:antifreeze glycopeptide [Thalassospira sp.]|uniref:antifreeze glycopeptide n=1 Tax=Thalassospira sp. TaxID=1912094 RepID=UPI000C554611|nr:antifreeze glycopeptide [Thalassospira sp.]MBC06070.1 antifreeze glycopeptide [Thalassospira sp.]|tara:strand:+ start:969 stop:3026 length:2058 start_codon:yes stop_codon:yes gene_type:complete